MERKKKVKKRENQPTIDPLLPGVGGLVGGERANYLRKKGRYYIFSIFCFVLFLYNKNNLDFGNRYAQQAKKKIKSFKKK